MSTQVIVTIVVGGLSVGLTLIIQAVSAGRMQGNYGARLTNVEGDIKELKDEQNSQWGKINEHGERISRVEGVKVRPNGGVH